VYVGRRWVLPEILVKHFFLRFYQRSMKILLLIIFFLSVFVFVSNKKLYYKAIQLNIIRYIVFVGRYL
jgi:hypothetical protein